LRTTRELCGDSVPKVVWLLQFELAKFRLGLIKATLNNELKKEFKDRNYHKEATLIKGISFWETLRDEASSELKEV